MRKAGTAYVVIAFGLIAVYLGYQLWFNPARAVKRRLGEIAATLSIPANDTPIARVARMAQLRHYLAENVHVHDGTTGLDLSPRDVVLSVVGAWTPPRGGWDVQFVDAQIIVESDTSARSNLTVEINGHDRVTGEATLDTREAVVTLVKQDGEWVIRNAVSREMPETTPRP